MCGDHGGFYSVKPYIQISIPVSKLLFQITRTQPLHVWVNVSVTAGSRRVVRSMTTKLHDHR